MENTIKCTERDGFGGKKATNVNFVRISYECFTQFISSSQIINLIYQSNKIVSFDGISGSSIGNSSTGFVFLRSCLFHSFSFFKCLCLRE